MASYSPAKVNTLADTCMIIIFFAGMQEFVQQHLPLVDECAVDSSSVVTICRKDIGDKGKLRHWSRGHVFVVHSCGHIDTWRPIFRYIKLGCYAHFTSHLLSQHPQPFLRLRMHT